jgi:hypothetical protein
MATVYPGPSCADSLQKQQYQTARPIINNIAAPGIIIHKIKSSIVCVMVVA